MIRPHSIGRWPIAGAVVLAVLTATLSVSSQALAQQRGEKKQKDEKSFEDVRLQTSDGVDLHCTYYAGSDTKETVPIILVHGWDNSRADLHQLALFLQNWKHAVIVPDLRGHGQSTRRVVQGVESNIDRSRMGRDEFASMVLDVEAAKKFLMEKNNQGLVNIEELCVVGFKEGSIIALNWAVLDWNARSLPAYKQGQDVKALAVVCPVQSFKGVTNQPAISHPIIRRDLSTLILFAADNRKSESEAKRLQRSLDRFHNADEKDLIYVPMPTNADGVDVLKEEAPARVAFGALAQFIDERLVQRAARFPWSDRTGPLNK